jgi:serine/threonine protein kinase
LNLIGFVIPEFACQTDRHYILKMLYHPVCLQEFTFNHRIDNRSLPSVIVKKFAEQIKASLDCMHEKLRLFHCDIKPGNILISSNSEALICDLGSVRGLGEGLCSSYNLPQDRKGDGACRNIDYLLLTTTVLEMIGYDVSDKMYGEIVGYVDKVIDPNLKSFLQQLLKF